MEPLAYKIRPKSFDDIVGQDHLVGPKGVIRKMLDQNKLFSLILYGPAGCGKTSIAEIIASYFPLTSFSFNASCDTKSKLKEISDCANLYPNIICIIDEIHRMKKDVQDYLLPFIESGKLTIVGLTTENPYRCVNPAIRSRCHIYRMNEIKEDDIILLLKKTIESQKFNQLSDDILKYIAVASSCEIRTALNMLEITTMLDKDDLTLENVMQLIGKKAFLIDEKGIKEVKITDLDKRERRLLKYYNETNRIDVSYIDLSKDYDAHYYKDNNVIHLKLVASRYPELEFLKMDNKIKSLIKSYF